MAKRVERAGPDSSRATTGREWELFVRERTDERLTHAGSVTAPTRELARERATQLLGWSATDVWLCPSAEIERVRVGR